MIFLSSTRNQHRQHRTRSISIAALIAYHKRGGPSVPSPPNRLERIAQSPQQRPSQTAALTNPRYGVTFPPIPTNSFAAAAAKRAQAQKATIDEPAQAPPQSTTGQPPPTSHHRPSTCNRQRRHLRQPRQRLLTSTTPQTPPHDRHRHRHHGPTFVVHSLRPLFTHSSNPSNLAVLPWLANLSSETLMKE